MSNEDSKAHAHHPASYYIRTYWILAVLLVLSIAGPLTAHHFGSMAHLIVLVTAFGIAVVKTLLVASRFMHLNTEKKFIWWLLITTLVAVFTCFAGIAPDVMNGNGHNWTNDKEFMVHVPKVHDCHPGSTDYIFKKAAAQPVDAGHH
jgi:caa(3)-type oxidase subunit IV